MAKVVQTDLDDEEYQMFVDFLEKRNLTIKEGLREVIRLFLRQELDLKTIRISGVGNQPKVGEPT